MLIVQHQQHIEVFKSKGKAIEIVQESFILGKSVSIFIQPENVEQFCGLLIEASKKEVIK